MDVPPWAGHIENKLWITCNILTFPTVELLLYSTELLIHFHIEDKERICLEVYAHGFLSIQSITKVENRWATDETYKHTRQQRLCWLMRSRWTTQTWQFDSEHMETNTFTHAHTHIHAYRRNAEYVNKTKNAFRLIVFIAFSFPCRHTRKGTQCRQGVHLFN